MKNVNWTIYHDNARGTGSAIRMELAPAAPIGVEGRLNIKIANQIDADPRVPIFDWKEAVTASLTAADVGELVMVLRGIRESIQDGKGIFMRAADGNRVFRAAHRVEPVPGYMITISFKPTDGEFRDAFFVIRPAEAIVMEAALSAGMKELVFG